MTIEYACVIHGDFYDWQYVERLHAMLGKHTCGPVQLHVFTEAERDVPAPFIKHALAPFESAAGPKRAWWYKMQLFNAEHMIPRMLYLDLDIAVVNNIDWLHALPTGNFYSILDYKYLWKPDWQGINSSIMLWEPAQWHWVWEKFNAVPVTETVRKYPGDQDFISSQLLGNSRLKYFDRNAAISWRWQALDGGYDLSKRQYRTPGSGTVYSSDTSFLVFHGQPKPHEIKDPVIQKIWSNG